MVPDAIAIFHSIDDAAGTHAFIANQIASTRITATITPQTMGMTFFELPLRGESFGAWL
jgi:hypothetical protein